MLNILLHLLVVELPSDQSLESEDGVLGVHNCLTLGWQTNQSLAVLGESNDGGGRPGTLGVLDDTRGLTLHYGDAGVGSSQVNTNDWAGDFS